MKKITKLLTVFALMAFSFNTIGLVHAETATNAGTRIDIEVTDDNKPLDPSLPPIDPVDPSTPGVVKPGENDESRPNTNIGDAKLAIWRIPVDMTFEGEYDPVLDLEFELGTESKKRILSIADVRKGGNTEWKLNSKLVNFKEQDSNETNEKLNNNVRLVMNAEAKKHFVNGKQVHATEFIDDSNGVEISELLEITNTESEVARAVNGNGKGYTGLIFNNIKLQIKGGNVEGTNYSGKINWTLSDTVN